MKHVSYKKYFSGSAIHLGAECARLIKLSFIVGSETAFFSAAHCLRPLAGLYSGVKFNLGALVIRSFFTVFSLHTTPFSALLYHIPSFFAALYWSMIPQSSSVRERGFIVLVLLSCFLSFIVHPVGSQAAPYALLWLIPLCSALVSHNSWFVHALASTFTAHAVGSVLWLYTVGPVVPQVWVALIPIALIERLLFASGMVFFIHLFERIRGVNGENILKIIRTYAKKWSTQTVS